MELAEYWNLHKGETCVIVGLGPNLMKTPPEWFEYPSFGVNTIYKYRGWKPTYFVGVDHRLMIEDGQAIAEAYWDIPKFIPAPDFDPLQGENFVRFKHRPGGLLYVGGQLANQREALTKWGITYFRVMEAVMQIAWHMGFTTMLMIGIEHNPAKERDHFWGFDEKSLPNQAMETWFLGYRTFVHCMTGVRVLNISQDTFVPDDVLPRGDWRDWRNDKVREKETA